MPRWRSTPARSWDAEVAETYAVGGGFLLLILGVVLSGPWLVARVAGGVARFGRGVPALLAGRRLQDDPGAGFRAISGVVLAVFVGSVFSGMAASMGSRPFALPGAGYWLALAGGLVVAVLVVLSTLPLLTRLTSPDTPHPE